jgi:molybdenum cofactor guanylyltransferase
VKRPVTAIVLAGGAGRRMGCDKRGLEVGGRPMLTAAVELAALVADDVIVSCRREAPLAPSLLAERPVRIVFDRRPGGPMAGLEACLAAARHDLSIVLPVDMPGLDLPMLEALADAAAERPDADGAIFPGPAGLTQFPAVLRRGALPLISRSIDAGMLRVGDMLAGLDLAVVSPKRAAEVVGPRSFVNVNFPDDLDPAERAVAAGARERVKSPHEEKRMDLERCLAAVRDLSGEVRADPTAPSENEVTALLDFTRAVAHAGERKDAPLAAYAMGVAMAALAPAQRAEVLARAAGAVDRIAGNTAE